MRVKQAGILGVAILALAGAAAAQSAGRGEESERLLDLGISRDSERGFSLGAAIGF